MKKPKMKPTVLLITSLFFALFLSLRSTVLAGFSVKNLNMPSQLGTIKESYEASSTMSNATRTIIHIQDAHCNYEAQKNMAQMLEYLVKEQNLRLIMVEGGVGDVSLTFLRGYADKKARAEVAEKYLKDGKISGEEYLDIISDYPLQLYGIEDKGLYDAHLASFEKIDSFREQGLKDLASISNIVNSLKARIYSKEFQQLEDKKNSYEKKAISLAEYCQYLCGIADKKKLGLDNYPHLAAFSETASLEKEINFQQAEDQRNAFIKDLAGLLDEREAQNLILMTQGFKAKMVTPERYYSFLKDTGEEKLDLKRKYPQLYAYIRYVTVSKDVNAAELLKEVNAVEEKIKGASLTTPEQIKLAEIDKSLRILTKVLNLELTPEDYEYFKANKPKFVTASWTDFLAQNCNRHNLAMQAQASKLIDANLQQFDEFYQLGIKREQAFIKNIVSKMDESGENLAVVITGGFHTPGVTQLLKEKGYSYVVASPVITQKSDSSVYFSVLRGEKKQQLEGAIN